MPKRIRRPLDDPDKLGLNSGRDSRTGRFVPGNKLSSGNEGQRQRGQLRRAIARCLSDQDLDAIISSAITAARRGDHHARTWLATRSDGLARSEPDEPIIVQLDLGNLDSISECTRAQQTITRAAAGGQITLAEASKLSWLVREVIRAHAGQTSGGDIAPNWDSSAPAPEYI